MFSSRIRQTESNQKLLVQLKDYSDCRVVLCVCIHSAFYVFLSNHIQIRLQISFAVTISKQRQQSRSITLRDVHLRPCFL